MSPPFQLQVAIALVAGALPPSLIHLVFASTSGKEKLALPVSSEGNEALLKDPFDVSTPEAFVQGAPIDEEIVWKKIKLWKTLLAVLLSAVLCLQCVSLGWTVVYNHQAPPVYVLHMVFALYILLLAIYSTGSIGSRHVRHITHLVVLTFLASALLTVTAVFPSRPLPVAADSLATVEPPMAVWYSVYGLYLISFLVAGFIPQGPKFHFPTENFYLAGSSMRVTSESEANVSDLLSCSTFGLLIFSFTTPVVMLGQKSEPLEIGDLPIVEAEVRAIPLAMQMRSAMRRWRLPWARPGSGIELTYQLARLNIREVVLISVLSVVAAGTWYMPAFFLRQIVRYLEVDPAREFREWGILFIVGMLSSHVTVYILAAHLFSICTVGVQARFKIQINSALFIKTLVRKDVASTAETETPAGKDADEGEKEKKEEFSSKAQVMTLMTTDVDRVSGFARHLFTIIDGPLEIVVGAWFLYSMLGTSSLIGLAIICISLPINHYGGRFMVGTQENLMKARDERVSLMNEVLGGIRMLKFMAWERSFEDRILNVRKRELKYQKLNYTIQVLFNALWNGTPILVTLASFWHFAVVRGETLTPSIAFTSISVFNEMKFAMSQVPQTVLSLLQAAVSLRRIETYLQSAEVPSVAPLDGHSHPISLVSATVTWPSGARASAASTPRGGKFILTDLNLNFPLGELSLVCGKLGSGKSLLLLALLGEADVLAGQVLCPRTPPDALAMLGEAFVVPDEEWIVPGVCAYVPQSAWLRNASIKDNILFDLPYVEERYQKTLQACALLSDLEILEDGDASEIGERGVNLSGGQKARVSLARAMYSRASTLFLDDVLSAVDAHTAHHLYNECLKGELMRGRTAILVSHHVQLCAAGAAYIVSLDNGQVRYSGDYKNFVGSDAFKALVQVEGHDHAETKEEPAAETVEETEEKALEEKGTLSDATDKPESDPKKKPPRKLVEDEKRATGHIDRAIWVAYLTACGGFAFWAIFSIILGLAASAPVFENGWLKVWSGSALESESSRSAFYYITVYAVISVFGLVLTTVRWLVIYHGGINASIELYKKLLESVLFANIRFHDTTSRGRLLNRFGKDFEGIDSSLPDDFGETVIHAIALIVTFATMTYVGGLPFVAVALGFIFIMYKVGKIYGTVSRELRRLDSVTRSPLYTVYGETIAGVVVVRAFGASSKFLRDMLRYANTNTNPYYWMWGSNRWLSTRFGILTSLASSAMALVAILTPTIDAASAGFALAFALTLMEHVLLMVRQFVSLEQSMVAVERVKEYTELPQEPPEFIEPRPPASWPTEGAIKCENLDIRYAADLPNVLHNLTFEVRPGEKVGVLGRTGSGKSTLALSFFRFVDPAQGRILVDDLDISKVGLTDLRSRLTIIPQDPTILSGTLRSTLDVFSEYEDAEIFEALHRVHLIPADDAVPDETSEVVNANVFRNLDAPVSEGGENFSTGEKQLLCMARAILKRSKVLVMDEATASVDYATDELIGKTIRQEFAQSTILTIAHRLRTVIDYDRIMLLDQGRIVEFDSPAALLANPGSHFYSLCKATGKREFAVLKKMAGA